ncbi:MAG TPA: hypothetical protein VMW16_12790 [Sedimentisphaerales bacterium]|nr:hypothetical protein [Sedimentisphaerales bacterium]
MTEQPEIGVLHKLTDILDKLGIVYAVSGSMASSAYGTVRFTQDADLGVQPFGAVAGELYRELKRDFYISEEAMRQALSSCGSFNVIDLETAFKVDIFIQGPDEFARELFARSRRLKISESIDKSFCFVSPEDIILLKLRWFKEGGALSDQQWADVLGVLGVQGRALDVEYLKVWAKKLDLADLLDRAISESRT